MKFTLILFIIFFTSCTANTNEKQTQKTLPDTLVFASYNVENLFDTIDDPHKRDNDYLPDGKKEWDLERYQDKLDKLSRVISGLKADIIGLTEVENRKVLDDLTSTTTLRIQDYGIVHEESPDARGIDVAILYRQDEMTYLDHKIKRIVFPWSNRKKTRDILLAKFLLLNSDTLCVIMNHWPSRIGGKEKSEKDRVYVAEQLKIFIDQSVKSHPSYFLINAGDFNDTPHDKSLYRTLGARKAGPGVTDDSLYNLCLDLPDTAGTYIYRGVWYDYDQIIVNGLILQNNTLNYLQGSLEIFDPPFLTEQTGKYAGYPFRTFGGAKYVGGYSDHFPIKMRFVIE